MTIINYRHHASSSLRPRFNIASILRHLEIINIPPLSTAAWPWYLYNLVVLTPLQFPSCCCQLSTCRDTAFLLIAVACFFSILQIWSSSYPNTHLWNKDINMKKILILVVVLIGIGGYYYQSQQIEPEEKKDSDTGLTREQTEDLMRKIGYVQ